MPKLKPGEKIVIPPEIRRKIYRILWPAVERIYRQKTRIPKASGQSHQEGY